MTSAVVARPGRHDRLFLRRSRARPASAGERRRAGTSRTASSSSTPF